MTKIWLFIIGLFAGLILGFSFAVWVLYEPVHMGSAKYALTRSHAAVPPYTIDGSKKLFRIECISESEKDCPQPTAIPEPGTLWLILIGLCVIVSRNFIWSK
jgi:hypothetical protein